MKKLFLRYSDEFATLVGGSNDTETSIDITDIKVSLNFSNADIDKLEGSSTKGSYSLDIKVPASKVNKKFFYFPEMDLSESFDDGYQMFARLEVDGTTVLDGYARIKKTIIRKEVTEYNILLFEGNSSWITNIKDATLRDLNTSGGLQPSDGFLSDYDHIYDRLRQDKSLTIDDFSLYTYPFINFGRPLQGDGNWTVEDRVPAFRVWKIFIEIFKQAGYSINSEFINSDFFKSLWFTPEKRPERSKDEILPHKFKVVREGSFILSQDGSDEYLNKEIRIPFSKVSPAPYFNTGTSSVVNLNQATGDGTHFNCQFRGRMSFKYDFHFENQSTSNTSGKDKIGITLRFKRARGFRYIPDATYQKGIITSIADNSGTARLTCTLDMPDGSYIRLNNASPYNGTWQVTRISSTVYDLVGSTYSSAVGAVYNGVEKMLQVDKTETLAAQDREIPRASAASSNTLIESFTTKSIDVLPNDKYYYTIEVKDGTANNQIVSIFPLTNVFSNTVYQTFVEGSTMVIEDVIPDFKQKEFIQDIRTAFNLYFYTDDILKQVTIEPRDDFYNGDSKDWSQKLDLSKPIEIGHLGSRLGKTIRFSYANDSKDKYIELKESQLNDRDPWNSYEFTNTHKAARDTTTEKKLKLFAPTYMGQGIATAPSARIPIIWDTDVDQQPDVQIKSWKSRLLYNRGFVDLPTGENLKFEGFDNSSYPSFVSSYYTDIGHDNQLRWDTTEHSYGLFDKHYLRTLTTINQSRKVYAWFNLSPSDINLLDFREPIYFNVEGDGAYYHLQKIIDYVPDGIGSVKCELIKLVDEVERVQLLTQETNFIENEIDETSQTDVPNAGDSNNIVQDNYVVMTEKVWMSTDDNPSGEFVDVETEIVSNFINSNGNVTNDVLKVKTGL